VSAARPRPDTLPPIGVVVLTTGTRPVELTAALDSVRSQRGVTTEVVVVLNAPAATPRPAVADARLLTPGRNLGIPGGRNLGVGALSPGCELVLFLDDDGALRGEEVLATAARRFAEQPELGALSLRIVDPVTGRTERRHVPRLRVGDARRSSRVTTFLGGASILRRAAFEAAGGLPEEFFYAHEETSLAWRMLDLGYRLAYAGDLVLVHPAVSPSRHATYHHLTARNRVLLARKHLPFPVAAAYLLVWVVLTLIRASGGRLASVRGFVDGFRQPDVVRAPIRWRTVWAMTLAGRPPVV
jgi:GT2 family glycosyltransferase